MSALWQSAHVMTSCLSTRSLVGSRSRTRWPLLHAPARAGPGLHQNPGRDQPGEPVILGPESRFTSPALALSAVEPLSARMRGIGLIPAVRNKVDTTIRPAVSSREVSCARRDGRRGRADYPAPSEDRRARRSSAPAAWWVLRRQRWAPRPPRPAAGLRSPDPARSSAPRRPLSTPGRPPLPGRPRPARPPRRGRRLACPPGTARGSRRRLPRSPSGQRPRSRELHVRRQAVRADVANVAGLKHHAADRRHGSAIRVAGQLRPLFLPTLLEVDDDLLGEFVGVLLSSSSCLAVVVGSAGAAAAYSVRVPPDLTCGRSRAALDDPGSGASCGHAAFGPHEGDRVEPRREEQGRHD